MLALARAGRRTPKAKKGIQREIQIHKNGVRKVKAPTKWGGGFANRDQSNKKSEEMG